MPVHRFNAPLDDDIADKIARIERSGEQIVAVQFDRFNDLWIFTRVMERIEIRGAA